MNEADYFPPPSIKCPTCGSFGPCYFLDSGNAMPYYHTAKQDLIDAESDPTIAGEVVRTLMAIDPGPIRSAYVVIDVDTRKPLRFGKILNDDMLTLLADFPTQVYIEMIASYGMPVGVEVFDTCVWIGRFVQVSGDATGGLLPQLIPRQPVKLHHCHSSKAKDSNIIRALVDRFAPGEPNYGKGSKIDPGWFYGFNADVWQAFALAVYAADTRTPDETIDLAPYLHGGGVL